MNDYFNFPQDIKKEDFRKAVRLLRQECFVVKSIESHRPIYNFIKRNKGFLEEYFGLENAELIIQESEGVATISNEFGRMDLTKLQTIVLLIIRECYAVKLREVSDTEKIFIPIDEIYERYQSLDLKVKFENQITLYKEICKALTMFKKFNLISYDGMLDSKSSDIQILVYPSIMLAIPMESIKEMLEQTKKLLKDFEVEIDAANDTNIE